MLRACCLAVVFIGFVWPAALQAADLAFVGPRGVPADQVANSLLAQTHNFDRSVAMENIGMVIDAVKTGAAAGGIIPAVTTNGVSTETTKLLLGTLDPGVHIIGETRQDGAASYWVIAPKERLVEQHLDRLVVDIESPPGAKAFSLVVAGLSKLGFTATSVGSIPLPGKPFGFRYLLALAADKPVLALRLTDAVARDSRTGEGRAVVIGAWKQVP